MSGKKNQRQMLSFDENEFCDDQEENAVAINFRGIHRSEDVQAVCYTPSDPDQLIIFQNSVYFNKFPDIQCKWEKKINNNVESYEYKLTSEVVPNHSPFTKLVSNLIFDYFGKIPADFITQPSTKERGEIAYFFISLITNGGFAEEHVKKFRIRLEKIYTLQHKKKLFIKNNFERVKALITKEDYKPLSIEKQLMTALPIINNAILIMDEGKCVSVLLTLKSEVSRNGKSLDELKYSTETWTKSIGCKATLISKIINTKDPAVYQEIDKAFKVINHQFKTKYLDTFEILPHTYNISSEYKNLIKRETLLDSYKFKIEQVYCFADEKD